MERTSTSRLGIMQGRLLPPIDDRVQCFPVDQWRAEFPRAGEAGLQCIEWIWGAFGTDACLIETDDGIAEIQELSSRHGVSVLSICANYFMENPLVRARAEESERRLDALCRLMRRGSRLGVNRIVAPFLDASRIETETEMREVIDLLLRATDVAEETGVALHLETSLPPQGVAEMLRRLPTPMIKINYDTGNSASLGYRPEEEFSVYGDRIGSVHIKDRRSGGGTVPLGTGVVSFQKVFDGLKGVGYAGDFILEAARGIPGEEVSWLRHYRAILRPYWPFKT